MPPRFLGIEGIGTHLEPWNGGCLILPSGKHTKNYGKSQFFMGKSTISMAMFNSYVKLPERRDMMRNAVLNPIRCVLFVTNTKPATELGGTFVRRLLEGS